MLSQWGDDPPCEICPRALLKLGGLSSIIVKLWSQLDWTGRSTPESTLSASDMLSVLRLYNVEIPEVWELLLMVERNIFTHRQGLIEKNRKQKLNQKNG